MECRSLLRLALPLKASPFVSFTSDIIVMIEFGVSGMSSKDS